MKLSARNMKTIFSRLEFRSRILALCLPAAVSAAAAADAPAWDGIDRGGIRYFTTENLRSFYKLTPLPKSPGGKAGAVGNRDIRIEFDEENGELNLGGTKCRLSHPLRKDDKGEILISKTDTIKLIDPILRPTYIAGRRPVRTIIIDPGHGGHDVGTQTTAVREADCTLAVAAKLKEILNTRLPGTEIILTRESNQYLSDQQRIDRISNTENPVFISLHLNSGRSDTKGVETYTAAPSEPNEQPGPGNVYDTANCALAYALQAALVQETGATDRACRRAYYNMLNSVPCPAALVEMGYATHEEEAAMLATDEYRTRLATALADGLCNYVRVMNPETKLTVVEAPPEEPPVPVKAEIPTAKPAAAKTAPKNTAKNTAENTGRTRGRTKSAGTKKPAATRSGNKRSGTRSNTRSTGKKRRR